MRLNVIALLNGAAVGGMIMSPVFAILSAIVGASDHWLSYTIIFFLSAILWVLTNGWEVTRKHKGG